MLEVRTSPTLTKLQTKAIISAPPPAGTTKEIIQPTQISIEDITKVLVAPENTLVTYRVFGQGDGMYKTQKERKVVRYNESKDRYYFHTAYPIEGDPIQIIIESNDDDFELMLKPYITDTLVEFESDTVITSMNAYITYLRLD
jgi:hypothetical protein